MNVLRNRQGFVFDFDGTLAILNIDFQAMRSDIINLAGSYGLDVEPLRSMYVLEMVEKVRHSLLCVEKADRFFCEAHQLIKDRELGAARCGGLLAGTMPLLQRLGEQRIRRGIITRNCEEAVRILFPEIDHFCEAFLPRGRVEKVKPDPGHLSTALACMEVEAKWCAMVGDHPMDIQCGKSQGLIAVGVLTGNADRTRLEGAGADIVVGHVGELLSLIDG